MSLLTRRIPTILGLFLLVVSVVGIFYYLQGSKTKMVEEVVPSKVRITNVADNKFSVSWTTSKLAAGAVEYGAVGDKLVNSAHDERDSASAGEYLTHQVTIENLQPSTQYNFRILSGMKQTRFDNNGSPYSVTTGPVIGAMPASQNFYGSVQLSSKQVASGALVYLTLPGGAPASTLVKDSGNYAFTLSTMRSSDLRTFVQYDASATIASVTVESGKLQSVASVSLANSAPVPTITLGQNVEFLQQMQTPAVAEVTPQTASSSADPSSNPSASVIPSTSPTPTSAAILNVEPMSEVDVNAVTSGGVVILNPSKDNETLATLRPEFRGTGPVGTTLTIALTGQKAISDTVVVATDKTWSWAPVIDLKAGKQTITITYKDGYGKTQSVARPFTASTTMASAEPAFVASPGASLKPTNTPRAGMPATGSGVPVTGIIENTLLTGVLGIVIMIIGASLFML
ncbi:MAG: fibronectin type III domain-containing protein [bacterium]